MSKLYNTFISKSQQIADIGNSIAVLGWDKEVNLPKGAARFRSQQISTLATLAHSFVVDKKYKTLVEKLSKDKSLNRFQKKNVLLTLEEINKATKFDSAFVKRRSELISKAYHDWVKAKEANDHTIFLPALEEIVALKKEEAEIIGYKKHPYDALLDIYEPKLTVDKLDGLFTPLKKDLKKIIRKINTKKQVDNTFLFKRYGKNAQWEYGIDILNQIGYDFNIGRQDVSIHPFTTSFSPQDVRVTTRIDENDFSNMLWSCIHEGGHALYEMGLPTEQYGLPLGEAVSLGIHESQSRLWENNVGRSLTFWKHNFKTLKKKFPKQLKGISLTKFYKAINRVEPNLIRTEADELHYHFHVIIRYEIEKELMEGKISVNDINKTWNKKYKSYLGLTVPDDARGMLQDIHWSHGSFGYFPTYSIGSLYAAQLYNTAKSDIDNLEEQIAKGNSSQLLDWLREKVHKHGRMYYPEQLCKRITGEGLNSKHFLKYAKEKYADIYRIQ